MNIKEKIFFKNSYKDLKTRFAKNNISTKIIKRKKILDFGCHNGRYSLAFNKMGAKEVDIFDYNIEKLIHKKNLKIIKREKDIKKKKNYYDLIFCNGILSHRKDWKRILKLFYNSICEGGYLWLSLYPKSKYWTQIDKITNKLEKKNKKIFSKLLKFRDWDEGKIYFISDLLFSDRIYFEDKKIFFFLNKLGFKKIKFLKRGTPSDLSEIVFKNKKLKKIFSNGEIRILAKK